MHAGGSPAASHFLLLRQKKVTQEKATPIRHLFEVPCVARLVRLPHKLARSATRPRAQTFWLRHNLKVSLRRNKPLRGVLSSEFPDQPALLGGGTGELKAEYVVCAARTFLFLSCAWRRLRCLAKRDFNLWQQSASCQQETDNDVAMTARFSANPASHCHRFECPHRSGKLRLEIYKCNWVGRQRTWPLVERRNRPLAVLSTVPTVNLAGGIPAEPRLRIARLLRLPAIGVLLWVELRGGGVACCWGRCGNDKAPMKGPWWCYRKLGYYFLGPLARCFALYIKLFRIWLIWSNMRTKSRCP